MATVTYDLLLQFLFVVVSVQIGEPIFCWASISIKILPDQTIKIRNIFFLINATLFKLENQDITVPLLFLPFHLYNCV
jgi:hypothetical protein